MKPYIFKGDLLIILIECMIFLSPFLDVTRMSKSTVSFLAQLDSKSSLPIECFPLTHDYSGFTSRINRHLFNCRFFLNIPCMLCPFSASFSCNSMSRRALHGLNPNQKKKRKRKEPLKLQILVWKLKLYCP